MSLDLHFGSLFCTWCEGPVHLHLEERYLPSWEAETELQLNGCRNSSWCAIHCRFLPRSGTTCPGNNRPPVNVLETWRCVHVYNYDQSVFMSVYISSIYHIKYHKYVDTFSGVLICCAGFKIWRVKKDMPCTHVSWAKPLIPELNGILSTWAVLLRLMRQPIVRPKRDRKEIWQVN